MPCAACGRGAGRGVQHPPALTDNTSIPDKDIWGPSVWRSLHIMTEHIGALENPLIQIDQARLFEQIIGQLPRILPCPECQQHTAAYLSLHPPGPWQQLRGQELRSAVRTYLFLFHNAVRQANAQPIMLATVEECQRLYTTMPFTQTLSDNIKNNVSASVRLGHVKLDNWKRWFILFNQLKIISGIR